MMSLPKVSILLPTYNAGPYLRDSVESILNQTYSSYELIILDDGSSDGSTDFLENLKDERVRFIKRSHNYIATLNYGLSIARGKYIARMDADDIMIPTRLAEQVSVLDSNEDIVICSTYMQLLGGNEIYNSSLKNEISHFAHLLLLGNFIAHPTVMLRSGYLKENNLKYRPQYIYAEDYKLWAEIACLEGLLYVIDKPLLKYRVSEGQTSRTHFQQQVSTAGKIKNELLQFLINRSGRYKSHLKKLYNAYALLNEDELLDDEYIFYGYYKIFSQIISEDE